MRFPKIAGLLTLGATLPLAFVACGDSNSSSADPDVIEIPSESNLGLSSGSDASNPGSSTDSNASLSSGNGISSPSGNDVSSSSGISSPSENQSSSSVDVLADSFTDARDGKTYKLTHIGTQIWMAEDLNFGDSSLYVYADAMKVCPEGFHLPSIEEFKTLVDFAGGEDVAAKKLKSTTGWPSSEEYGDWNGTDDYGFNAKPITLGNGKGTDENFWSTDRNYSNYMTENFLKLDPYPTSTTYPDIPQPELGAGYAPFCQGRETSSPSRSCFVSAEPDTRLSVRCLNNKLNCGGKTIDYADQFCQDDVAYDLCRGRRYDGTKYVCKDNNLHDRSTDSVYKFSWIALKAGTNYGIFLDKRDNQYYKTIEIDGVTWFAENLNYEVDSSICHEFNPKHCDFYGRMYTQKMALNGADSVPSGKVQGICPEGTHLPTHEEFSNLLTKKYDLRSSYIEDDYKGPPSEFSIGKDDVGFSKIYPGYCGDEDVCGEESSWSRVNQQTMLIGSNALYADLDWYNSGLKETKVVHDYEFGSIRCIVDE